jgi:hypothetical protein
MNTHRKLEAQIHTFLTSTLGGARMDFEFLHDDLTVYIIMWDCGKPGENELEKIWKGAVVT